MASIGNEEEGGRESMPAMMEPLCLSLSLVYTYPGRAGCSLLLVGADY